MNSRVFTLVILSIIVGTLADYGAPPAKYEPPKGGYGGGGYGGGYAAPPPKSGGYGDSGGYGGAPMVHTYPAKAPSTKCGANLLVSCAPTVAHVPCIPSGGYGDSGGYGGHGY
ncbi:vitelline membrane protein 15a-2-like [Toxorhynchites rutilus septentrionalis]|uniref:vitelline membrane protein 15a-2-like n=1 Tax=Toxorhynchites rutilus septentrionalis TaxID=329112 RepID=UPI0024788FD2|nr:vitelline membrane protein 15a-2-like [Toxorhynchites rutilus septentrionalis]